MIWEKDCIVSEDRGLSEISNWHFVIITKTLDIKTNIISTTKSLPKIFETFKDHSSIKNFFSFRGEECQFKFHFMSECDVRGIILKMNEKIANRISDILTEILKDSVNS